MKNLQEAFDEYRKSVIGPCRLEKCSLDGDDFLSRIFHAGAFSALSMCIESCKEGDLIEKQSTLAIEAMLTMLLGSSGRSKALNLHKPESETKCDCPECVAEALWKELQI